MADDALRAKIRALTTPQRRCETPGCAAAAVGFHRISGATGWQDACADHLGVLVVGGEERCATDVYGFPGEPRP